MRNWQRWFISLVAGFLGGLITCAAEESATTASYIRHGLLGMAPTVAALKMTLSENEK